MSFSIENSTNQPNAFFDILPQDWQESIVPFWPSYHDSAQIMVLKKDTFVVGGGIVFSTVSPDTKIYESLAKSWFDLGYLYLGFLWIDEKYRNQKLGTLWLQEIINQNPLQKYWLTVEDENLIQFYSKNQFRLIQKIELPDLEEWLLVKDLC